MGFEMLFKDTYSGKRPITLWLMVKFKKNIGT